MSHERPIYAIKMISIQSAFLLTFLILNSVSCDRDWWKTTNIYQVYVRSFKDSDGDGAGDLRGVASRLDHFVDLGVETIWLSPFFKSPMVDMGYDIQNFTAIDPLYGTMEDFDALIKKMKSHGLKFLLDFVPNHCSEKHEWFQKSIKRIHPYTDYFIWKDPAGYDADKKPIPPNNWVSVFSAPAWTFNIERGQFYLHQFAPQQPDLNLRNKRVRNELLDVLRFWANKGVQAFRLDATKHMIEDAQFRDENYLDAKYEGDFVYAHINHNYTTDLWESYELIHEWRTAIEKEYTDRSESIIFVAEAYTTLNYTMMYYGSVDYPITNFPFNFMLITHIKYPTAYFFNEAITSWINNMPHKDSVPNWVVENHDNPRVADRHCREFTDLMNIMIFTLPGVPCVYYGQEIGMEDANVRPDQRKDPNNDGIDPNTSRDGERSPMQWDDSVNAGFTSKHRPWLPLNSNYWYLNVKKEKKSKFSHYTIMKQLMQFKKTATAKFGDLQTYVLSNWTFAFTRSLKNHETFVVVFNFGSETETIELSSKIDDLPPFLKVEITSLNAGYYPGDLLPTTLLFSKLFTMRPKSALVLTTNVNDEDTTLIISEPRDLPTTPTPHDSSSTVSLKFYPLIGLLLCFVVIILNSE